MKYLMLSFLFVTASLTACISSDQLSTSEVDALAVYARKMMSDGIQKNRVVSIPMSSVAKTPDGTFFKDRAPGAPRNTYEVAEIDMDIVRKELPVCTNFQWKVLEERRGRALMEWVGPSGARYGIEFSGPLDNPARCATRLHSPQRVGHDLSNIVRQQLTDSDFLKTRPADRPNAVLETF